MRRTFENLNGRHTSEKISKKHKVEFQAELAEYEAELAKVETMLAIYETKFTRLYHPLPKSSLNQRIVLPKKKEKSDSNWRDISNWNWEIASIYSIQGKFSDGLGFIEEGIAALKNVNAPTYEDARKIAFWLGKLANFYHEEKRPEKARNFYLKAITARSENIQYKSDEDFREISKWQIQLAYLAYEYKHRETASDFLRQAINSREKINFPSDIDWREIGAWLGLLGKLANKDKQLDLARELYGKSAASLEKITGKSSNDYFNMALYYEAIGDYYRNTNDKLAGSYFRYSKETLNKIRNKSEECYNFMIRLVDKQEEIAIALSKTANHPNGVFGYSKPANSPDSLSNGHHNGLK